MVLLEVVPLFLCHRNGGKRRVARRIAEVSVGLVEDGRVDACCGDCPVGFEQLIFVLDLEDDDRRGLLVFQSGLPGLEPCFECAVAELGQLLRERDVSSDEDVRIRLLGDDSRLLEVCAIEHGSSLVGLKMAVCCQALPGPACSLHGSCTRQEGRR